MSTTKPKTIWKRISRICWWTFRLFNLHEPDVSYPVISLSKLSVWMTLGLTVYVVGTGHGMTEIGGALIANVGAVGNYAYRRSLQARMGRGSYGHYDSYSGGNNAYANSYADQYSPGADQEMPFEEEPQP